MTRRRSNINGSREVFPLLDLPPEIRITIWKYIVLRIQPIEVEHRTRIISNTTPQPSKLRSGRLIHQEDEELRKPTILALAFTCQQLYNEVAPVYYSGNVFHMQLKGLSLCGLLRAGSTAQVMDDYLDEAYIQMSPFIHAIGRKNVAATCTYLLEFTECEQKCAVSDCRWEYSQLLAVHRFLMNLQSHLLGRANLAVQYRYDILMTLREDQKLALWIAGGRCVLRLEDATNLRGNIHLTGLFHQILDRGRQQS